METLKQGVKHVQSYDEASKTLMFALPMLTFQRLVSNKGRTYLSKPAALEGLFKHVWPFSGHQVFKG